MRRAPDAPDAPGFSLIELLVAFTVCGLLFAAIAGSIVPARTAFTAAPALVDLRQRARSAVDSLTAALRSSVAVTPFASDEVTDEDGEFNAVWIVTAIPPARGYLDRNQSGPSGALTLAPSGCPQVTDVCGFRPGVTAAVLDDLGGFDIFTVQATNAGQRSLRPSASLSSAHPAGALVIEVQSETFELQRQGDGTRTLMRIPAGSMAEPMIDGIVGLSFSPFYEGDLLIRIDVGLRVRVLDEFLHDRSQVPERRVEIAVALRNTGAAR